MAFSLDGTGAGRDRRQITWVWLGVFWAIERKAGDASFDGVDYCDFAWALEASLCSDLPWLEQLAKIVANRRDRLLL